ncbi:hypothetical protein [Mucilaginibacter sp.]|uniref:hypothetical protein n=1 Tax=Mucilaginibacter sp. TaxID=1882438 RepID=UPI002601EEAC|nr:hypothetical protein [Mucilaginibacter sp.]MDB5127860.1 hypothetical protein [Mucilaginibacter sp.]
MKKALLIVIVFGLLFGSCKKNNHIPPPAKVTIVGKWKYKKSRSLFMDSQGTILSEDVITDYTDNDFLQYNADGTGLSMLKGSKVDFTYSFIDSIDTEYTLPRSAGDKPLIFTVFVLTATALTRQNITYGPGEFRTIRDEDFVKF